MGPLARWSNAWRDWRQNRVLSKRPIPDPLWLTTLARYPFIARRSTADLARLRQLATLFLAEKEFTGAGGLQATDEIAVAIAVQACLPILHLGLSAYDDFIGIVVHPDEVVAEREVMDEDGIVHSYEETLTGEAMSGGPVMLSWRDVAEAGESAEQGYNVVIHEFVHVLDMRDGVADGVPLLPNDAARQRWIDVLDREYEAFCDSLDNDPEPAIDPYGAEAPEEFFAVAAEAFFVSPQVLLHEHPALYRLLQGYFRQDPAAEATGS
ncbi:zinc-dependent peptidase [Piscinibacter sakaiensis]|uniref:M90 family metallopeptidase n=1 Tax=Piscinibacter sakaiensis TaxID=1547922 RepID=UPI003AACA276